MRFQEYLPQHEEIFPKPTRRRPELGWLFWVSISVAVAAIVLASLRTANTFFAAAELSAALYGFNSLVTTGLSFVEAAAAMIAIEGGIVYGSVKRAQTHGKVHPRLFVLYIALLITISIIAGLGQSLGLVIGLSGQLLAIFTWVMALVLGVGASIVAWLSGEMLGVELLDYEKARKNSADWLKGAETKWLNDARKAWQQIKNQPQIPDFATTAVIPAGSAAQPTYDIQLNRVKQFMGKIAIAEHRIADAGEVGKAVGLSTKKAQEYIDVLQQRAAAAKA